MRKVIGLLGCGVLLATFCEGAVFFYQEPEQYVMAQAKAPEPAVKPVLDISGIAEIQSIPVGEMREYPLRETIEELELEGWIPLELILESIAHLAIMQMGLDGKVEWSVYPKEMPFPEGTFGWALQEILGVDPERDFGLTVEHTDFIRTPVYARDCFLLTINCRQIELDLLDYSFLDEKPEWGNWGVRGLLLKQVSEKEFAPNGLPYTEEKELFIDKDKDTGKFYAYYTVRVIGTDGVKVIKYEQMKFEEGNPKPVWHRPLGPP